MAVMLINPDSMYIASNGEEIGPLQMTEGAAGSMARAKIEMERIVEMQETDEARVAAQAQLDIFRDALWECGLEA